MDMIYRYPVAHSSIINMDNILPIIFYDAKVKNVHAVTVLVPTH